jgi:hypothetical protein
MSYPVAPLTDTNSRQSVQTIRPPSTSLLTIDSEDRFENYTQASAIASLPPATLNTTPYYFAIRKRESLMNGFFTRVGITEICFPWSIPNINRRTRDIQIEWSGSSAGIATITLLDGFYTPAALADAIQTEVLGIAGNPLPAFTMTYGALDTPTFGYRTNNAALAVAFYPMDYGSADYPYPNTTKQLFHLLGFSDLNSEASTLSYGGFTFCQATRYVDICCFQLTNNQALKDQTSQVVARDMLARVYLGDGNIPGNTPAVASDPDFCPPGCAPYTIYRNYASPKQIQWIPNQPIPGYLLFQLFDDAGAPLTEILEPEQTSASAVDQAAYLDWSMTMQVSEN